MADLILFQPKSDLDAEENLNGFIDKLFERVSVGLLFF